MRGSQGFQINWLGSVGSALGAVSSAVLLSTLGAAGTLFGAALGSLIITVGGSLYTQSLQKTRDRVVKAGDRSNGDGSSQVAGVTDVDDPEPLVESSEDSGEAPKKSLPWKRVIVLSVGLFAVAMALILAFELSTGKPVSSYTGGSDAEKGTTFSRLGSSSENTEAPDADGDNQTTESDEPTKDEPAEEKPAEEDPVEEQPADPPPAEQPPAEAPPADTDE